MIVWINTFELFFNHKIRNLPYYFCWSSDLILFEIKHITKFCAVIDSESGKSVGTANKSVTFDQKHIFIQNHYSTLVFTCQIKFFTKFISKFTLKTPFRCVASLGRLYLMRSKIAFLKLMFKIKENTLHILKIDQLSLKLGFH